MTHLKPYSIRKTALCHPMHALPWLVGLCICVTSCTGAATTTQQGTLPSKGGASTQCEARPGTLDEIPTGQEPSVNLGKFSVSLTVKDLPTSRKFYETLGFEMIAGAPEDNWILLKNGRAKIGLFQGMFDDNLMTFNPTNARGIERIIEKAGYKLETATTGDTGPTSFIVKDPDGNTILVDQF